MISFVKFKVIRVMNLKIKKSFLILIFIMLCSTTMFSQYVPTSENLKARGEFQDDKFGIFLHWGIYSMTAQGEWYMNNKNIRYDEYAKLASGFYPSLFDASEWVNAVKASGAKYITITSRHHTSEHQSSRARMHRSITTRKQQNSITRSSILTSRILTRLRMNLQETSFRQ